MVPIVEPEVLMDGDHSIEQSLQATEATLHSVFAALGAPQVIILSLVVAIAAALYALSRHPAAKA